MFHVAIINTKQLVVVPVLVYIFIIRKYTGKYAPAALTAGTNTSND
jgi:hypothetical protein